MRRLLFTDRRSIWQHGAAEAGIQLQGCSCQIIVRENEGAHYMAFVDDNLLTEMKELVPLGPMLHRLRAIQHDHLTELPELLLEIERARHTLTSVLDSLPRDRATRYWRLYADLLWASTMMVYGAADSEHRGKLCPELLGL